MEIRWSVRAAEDLERICAWIERDNPEAVQRVAKIIYDGCTQLRDFPNMGLNAGVGRGYSEHYRIATLVGVAA